MIHSPLPLCLPTLCPLQDVECGMVHSAGPPPVSYQGERGEARGAEWLGGRGGRGRQGGGEAGGRGGRGAGRQGGGEAGGRGGRGAGRQRGREANVHDFNIHGSKSSSHTHKPPLYCIGVPAVQPPQRYCRHHVPPRDDN